MSVLASVRSQLAPIHREGLPFIGGFALASLLLFWLWSPLGWLGTMATLWCVYFFRDPQRVTPTREGNVRNSLVIATDKGRIGVVQIAGLVARRIVCFVRQGATVGAGERIGMIRFGSRLDVYLPDGDPQRTFRVG